MPRQFCNEIADKNIHMNINHINAKKKYKCIPYLCLCNPLMQYRKADMYLEGYIWLRLETKSNQQGSVPEVLPSLIWQQ